MEQVQPLEPTRSSADVSVALNPASSFASLRSVRNSAIISFSASLTPSLNLAFELDLTLGKFVVRNVTRSSVAY